MNQENYSRDNLLAMIDRLLRSHSPPGEEDEIDSIITELLQPNCDDLYQDRAGNIVGLVKGSSSDNPVRIMAHKDEIALAVKKIEDNGRIRVDMLGALFPWKVGEIPVEILAGSGIVKGVLSIGSLHTSSEGSPQIRDLIDKKPLKLSDTHITTHLTKTQLTERGVYPGTRAVIARQMKAPFLFNDCVSGYMLDNKGAVALMAMMAEHAKKQQAALDQDMYFVATTMEEVGAHGAVYAAHNLPGDLTIALEIGPVAEEYGAELNDSPVVWYGPSGVYDKKLSDAVLEVAHRTGIPVQPIYYWGPNTDASRSRDYGMTAKALCIAFPCDNTHGYEVATIGGLVNTYRLLTEMINNKVIF